MTPELSDSGADACLEVIYRGLVLRAAAGCGESALAEAIADSLQPPALFVDQRRDGRIGGGRLREHDIGRLAEHGPHVFGHIAEPLLELDAARQGR